MKMRQLLFALFASLLLKAGQSQTEPGGDYEVGCYQDGECLGAAFTDVQPIADPVDCHQLCIDTPDCEFWTHYNDTTGGDDYSCFAFLNCPDFSDEGCDNCVSGDVDCPLQGACEVQGQCDGVSVDFYNGITTVEECAQLCACDIHCGWWTLDTSIETCFLTEDCEFLDETCTTCTAGERGCDSTFCESTTESDVIMCPEDEEADDVIQDPSCPTTYLVQNEQGFCYFSSPNYPDGYTDSMCRGWVVRSIDGADFVLHLEFPDFDLESCCDHVLVYDGEDEDAPLVEDVHAPVDPRFDYWHAFSGHMYLRFETDSSVSGSSGYGGFLARIRREEPGEDL